MGKLYTVVTVALEVTVIVGFIAIFPPEPVRRCCTAFQSCFLPIGVVRSNDRIMGSIPGFDKQYVDLVTVGLEEARQAADSNYRFVSLFLLIGTQNGWLPSLGREATLNSFPMRWPICSFRTGTALLCFASRNHSPQKHLNSHIRNDGSATAKPDQ